MVFDKLKKYGEMVMFSHTLFSLPFGLIAMIWAAGGIPELRIFFWILVALFGARNGANAFNRIADRNIDKKNERTKDRHLATGEISLYEAYGVTIFCFLIMAFAAYMLNLTCLILLPFAIGIFIVYSYSKRFTWLCHFILGTACGGAPVGAWLAVTGEISLIPLFLGAAVCFWVGGFDILYATQDIAFDRKEGLHSIPARFGLKASLWIARASHCMSILCFIAIYMYVPRGIFFLIGIITAILLLGIEHYNVAPENKNKMIFASYHMNQLVSIVFFIFAMIDIGMEQGIF
ncbi:MAG: 4-hydroxybenzoate polyprenyltransferase [Lachnospiraceae bacterium]|jgi:4-hydroxybenzoate polyprenyltransferase|nr:4-hydroxybenzoate polyprenyltransferase [Lachnospiraceae bacterium]